MTALYHGSYTAVESPPSRPLINCVSRSRITSSASAIRKYSIGTYISAEVTP